MYMCVFARGLPFGVSFRCLGAEPVSRDHSMSCPKMRSCGPRTEHTANLGDKSSILLFYESLLYRWILHGVIVCKFAEVVVSVSVVFRFVHSRQTFAGVSAPRGQLVPTEDTPGELYPRTGGGISLSRQRRSLRPDFRMKAQIVYQRLRWDFKS